MKRRLISSVMASIFFLGFSCWVTATPLPTPSSNLSTQSAIQDEAGFITLEPMDFYFHAGGYFSRLQLRSSEAKIWYSFKSADEDAAEKPLFIFFNGGPGGATSSGLMSMYTSRWTVDNSIDSGGGDRYIANPVSWTQLGNLMHVDARNTGFSYDVTGNPANMAERRMEFNAQNYNAYIDGADFIRVLFRFMANHPELRDNPVVIVGESYGGIRSTVMLFILHNYRDFANDVEFFQAPSLVEEIQAHYNIVFPGYLDSVVPREVISRQFGRQILIQAAVSRGSQRYAAAQILEAEGSLIYQIAGEEGLDFIPCRLRSQPCDSWDVIYDFILEEAGRDYYMVARPRDWLWGFFENCAHLLGFTENLSQMTGVDATQIPGLYASARANAYRAVDPAEVSGWPVEDLPGFTQMELQSQRRVQAARSPADMGLTPLAETFGTLQPWDFFFLDLNYDANYAHWSNVAIQRGYIVPMSFNDDFGRMFLKNVSTVKTFFTCAKYDIVVYSPALPLALSYFTGTLSAAIHDTGLWPGDERAGRIKLHYHSGVYPDQPDLQTRYIRFPFYDRSCHAVSLTEPVELFHDVSVWLNEDN